LIFEIGFGSAAAEAFIFCLPNNSGRIDFKKETKAYD